MLSRSVVTLSVLMSLLLAPCVIHAQACYGVPTTDGAVSIIGAFSLTNGAKGYGGNVSANLTGPITLQAGFGITDIDDVDSNITSFNAGAGYELPHISFSACPFVGAGYSTWSETLQGIDVDFTQTVIPVGLALGRVWSAGPTVDLNLYAAPQFLYFRGRASASDGTTTITETDSSSEFGLELGFALGNGSVFGGGGVSITSIDDSDPVFTASVGFAVGGSRTP